MPSINSWSRPSSSVHLCHNTCTVVISCLPQILKCDRRLVGESTEDHENCDLRTSLIGYIRDLFCSNYLAHIVCPSSAPRSRARSRRHKGGCRVPNSGSASRLPCRSAWVSVP